MLNKFIISGIVAESPRKYSLGDNLVTVKVKNNTEIRLNSSQKKSLETIQNICVPIHLMPPELNAGDSVYMDCANVPAFTLSSEQHVDVIWANVVHLTPSTEYSLQKAV